MSVSWEINVILTNNVNLAGHIDIGDHAILGGLTAVQQFVKIGAHVMVGGGRLSPRTFHHLPKQLENL
ncbi:MAG: hypothetical protein IPI90_12650 [Saprospiraceae bacterium]|nr:hypothetical protein [Candidatus Vicinibacter affinis]